MHTKLPSSFLVLAALGLCLASADQATANTIVVGDPSGSGYVEGTTDARDINGMVPVNLDTQHNVFAGSMGSLDSSYRFGGVTSTYHSAIATALTLGISSLTANVSGSAQVAGTNDGAITTPPNTVHSATSFWSTQFTADSAFSATLHLANLDDVNADLASADITGAGDVFTQSFLSIDDSSGNYVQLVLGASQVYSPGPQPPHTIYRGMASDGTMTDTSFITVTLPAGAYTLSARINATAEFGARPTRDSDFVSGFGSFTGRKTDGAGDVSLSMDAAVPEPATATLLGIGIAGMAGFGWRRRKPAVLAR